MAYHCQPTGTLTARWLPLVAPCYPPLILGLAAFLLALLCCRTAPPEYQAEAVLLREAAEIDGASGDVEAWLKSDAVLRAALSSAQWPELTEGAAAEQSRAIAELRDRVQTTSLHQPDESPRLAIRCTAPRGAIAMNLVRELAMQVADHFERQRQELARRQLEENLGQIRERLRVARDAEEGKRGELERLRHGQLAMVVANPRSQTSGRGGKEADNLNPRWVELKKQLDALQNQRAEMLEVLRENHPEISGLNLRIAKVSGSLSKTPRQLAAPIEPISHGVSFSERKLLVEWRRETSPVFQRIRQQQFQQETPAAPVTRQGLDPFLNMAAQIDEAAHQLAVLTSQRKGIEWDQAALEQSLGDQSVPRHSAWRTEPARRIAKIGGGYNSQQLRWGSVFSLGAMGLVVLSQRRILGGQRLASLADVLIHVRLPLTGAVELPTENQMSFFLGSTPLRLATRCGEAFLLGIVITCLASAWLDPSLSTEFRLDPVGAFAETARRIL
jgi:hypothetical protein